MVPAARAAQGPLPVGVQAAIDQPSSDARSALAIEPPINPNPRTPSLIQSSIAGRPAFGHTLPSVGPASRSMSDKP